MTRHLLLASRSPRRRELLGQLGATFASIDGDVDETRRPGEPPAAYVERVAIAKARAGAAVAEGDAVVLGADTAVVVDEDVLGKPRDRADALAMLGRLSGRRHEVLTAVALVDGARVSSRVVLSRVGFRPLRTGEAAAYWDGGEPRDKAGAYAIQGRAARFVDGLEGSYTGVVGLPLFETAELLVAAGVELAW